MYRNTRERGITLIALVVTIIILLILAGISIATLTGENGLITKAKEATTEYKKAQAKEELQLKISDMQLKITGEESREATLDDFNNLIEEDKKLTFISASYNTSSTETSQGEFETIKVIYKNYIFTVDSYLEIADIEENTNTTKVDLNYDVKEKKEKDGKVIYIALIKFQSNKKITKVEYGEQILKADTGIEEIAIDFEAEKDTEYTFKITTLNGESIDKSLKITEVPIKEITLEKKEVEMKVLDSYKVNYSIEPDFAEENELTWSSSNEKIATVNEGVIKAKAEGEATITVKSKNAQATCHVTVVKTNVITATGTYDEKTGITSLNIEEIVDSASTGDIIYIPEGEYKLTQINTYHSYANDQQVGINDKGKSLTFVGENEKTKLIYYGEESSEKGGHPIFCLNSETIIRNMIIEFYPGKTSYARNALFSHTYGNVYNVFFIIKDTNRDTCYGYNNMNYLNINIKNCNFYFENTDLVKESYRGRLWNEIL